MVEFENLKNPRHLPENAPDGMSRRLFIQAGTAALGGLSALAAEGQLTAATQHESDAARSQRTRPPSRPSSFLELIRMPDAVVAFGRFEKTLPSGMIALTRSGEEWTSKQVVVGTKLQPDSLDLTLAAPSTPIVAVHLRWRIDVRPELFVLGDAWERSYGDLEIGRAHV